MASTYTTNGGLEQIGTGEQAGTWGDTTNTNMEIVDTLTNGVKKALSIAGATIGIPATLNTANGAVSNGTYKVIEFTGALTEKGGVSITPVSSQKLYFVKNATSGGFAINFKQSSGSGTTVDVGNGKTAIIYADGAASNPNVAAIETGSDEFTDDVTMSKAGGVSLTLQTDATAISDTNSLGRLQFQAPEESDGSPENAVVATVEGIAAEDFTGNANKTKLSFKTADGAAVLERMKIESYHATNKGSVVTITSGSTDVDANDIIGALDFQAPLEATGGDAILVLAKIQAVAEEDFSGTVNETQLEFWTAKDGAAVKRFEIDGDGRCGIPVDGNLTTNNLFFGTDHDFKLFHNGNDSVIHNSTGTFRLLGNTIAINNSDESGAMALFTSGAGAKIYFNNTSRFETFDGGCKVIGDLNVTGDITAYWVSSDKNLKENIKIIPDALEKISKLSGYTFNWNETAKELNADAYTDQSQVGVIAQEVEEVFPELVNTRENGFKGVKYPQLIPLLIEAIKEQQKQIDELKQNKIDR